MKNKDKNNTVPVESIALLKTVHEQIIKILSTLANRNFEQRDYQLNSLYQTLTAISDQILFDGSDYFKEYGIRPPRIPENLIGDIEEIDILWETQISSDLYGFLGKIEGMLFEAKYSKPNLTPELHDIVKKVDEALDRIIRQDDEDFAKYVAEKQEKDPFAKREDKLVRPKVNRIIKAGSLNLNLTSGTLQYGNNPPVEISPEKAEVKFLAILMSNQRIVEYKEFGEEFMRGSSVDRSSNRDSARNIQFLKRDLISYLKNEAKMPKDQVAAISKMIEAKRGKGYKLRVA